MMAWAFGSLGLLALFLAAVGFLVHGTTHGGLPPVKWAAVLFLVLALGLFATCAARL